MKMNPIEMVKSISLKTKERKWGVSLFPHGCSSRGGGGDGAFPESWPAARPHLPCASDQDGVSLLSVLSLFIVFASSACILLNRALITEYSSTLCCLGLEFLSLHVSWSLVMKQKYSKRVLSSSWSFVDLILLPCYMISAFPFTLTCLS